MTFLTYFLNTISLQTSLLIVFIISIYSKSISFFKYFLNGNTKVNNYNFRCIFIGAAGSLLILIFISLYLSNNHLGFLYTYADNFISFHELILFEAQLIDATSLLIWNTTSHFQTSLEEISKLHSLTDVDTTNIRNELVVEFNNNLITLREISIRRCMCNVTSLTDYERAEIFLKHSIVEYSKLMHFAGERLFIDEIDDNSWSFMFIDWVQKIRSLF